MWQNYNIGRSATRLTSVPLERPLKAVRDDGGSGAEVSNGLPSTTVATCTNGCRLGRANDATTLSRGSQRLQEQNLTLVKSEII